MRQARALLLADRPLAALALLIEQGGLRLSAAQEYYDRLWSDTRRELPIEAEPHVRVLLARGERQAAVSKAVELTSMALQQAESIVDDLQPSTAYRVSRAVEDEAWRSIADDDWGGAARLVRSATGLGLRDALAYCRALQASRLPPGDPSLMEAATTLDAPEPPALTPELQARIQEQFAREDWDGVTSALSQYGRESHEKEPERIRMAILDLADGDVVSLLNAVQAAKTDYRDVLSWVAMRPSRRQT